MIRLFIILFFAGLAFGVADSNLVAHYKMDDNAASTVVIDEKGHNGTSVRNTSLLHAMGKVGGALYFNGTDYIDTNQAFQDTFQNSFTISFWCKLDDGRPVTSGGLEFLSTVKVVEGDAVACVSLWYHNTGCIHVTYQYTTMISSSAIFSDGQQDWVMITATITRLSDTTVDISLYVNGVLNTSAKNQDTTWVGYYSDAPLGLGAQFVDGVPYPWNSMYGFLDNVMIFNKALSAAEVLQLYNEANPAVTDSNSIGRLDDRRSRNRY